MTEHDTLLKISVSARVPVHVCGKARMVHPSLLAENVAMAQASYGYQMTYWKWSYLVGNHLFEVSNNLSHARMLHLAGFYGHEMVRLVNIGPEFSVNFRHHSWLVVTGTC